MFEFSTDPTIEVLRKDCELFRYEKMKWGSWQTARNLFLALVGELGELSTDVAANEGFANPKDCSDSEEDEEVNVENTADNKEKDPKVETVLCELADVFSYLICLAQECQVDLAIPDSCRDSEPSSNFSDVAWNEIEVTAFYQTVRISEKTSIIKDFLSLCFSTSQLNDIFQWITVEKNLKNFSMDKQQIVDKILKKVFCHVVVIASKYEYDLPKLLKEKNAMVAEKYSKRIGILTKDDVIDSRYSDLPNFYLDADTPGQDYLLDKPVNDLKVSADKLVCKLMESIGLIAEIFQWDTDGTETVFSPAKHAHLCNQLSMIINVLRTLAQVHKMSFSDAFNKKMHKNRAKYPVGSGSGIFVKYNEMKGKVPNLSSGDALKSVDTYQTVSTIGGAAMAMQSFVEERKWQKYHRHPRNLTLALFGEIGEVIELFIMKKGKTFDQCLGDELSDCVAYTVQLASCCNVDLSAAMTHYFP